MDYYTEPRISNSSLNLIDPERGGCPAKFKDYLDGKLDEKPSKFLDLGRAVHTALLEPEKLHVADFESPSDTIKAIMDSLIFKLSTAEIVVEADIMKYHEVLSEVIDEFGYQKNWKPETRLKKVIEEGEQYFNHMVEAGDGYILDKANNEKLVQIQFNLSSNELANTMIQGIEKYERFVEQEIYFGKKVAGSAPEKELELKAKLDMLYYNPESGYFHIVDLKTTHKSMHDFEDELLERKYHRQIAFYEMAAVEFLREKGYENVRPGTHYIVSVQTKDYYNVRVFVLEKDVVAAGHKDVAVQLDRIWSHMQTGDWIHEHDEHGRPVLSKVVRLK